MSVYEVDEKTRNAKDGTENGEERKGPKKDRCEDWSCSLVGG